jgi:hypothetical protein
MASADTTDSRSQTPPRTPSSAAMKMRSPSLSDPPSLRKIQQQGLWQQRMANASETRSPSESPAVRRPNADQVEARLAAEKEASPPAAAQSAVYSDTVAVMARSPSTDGMTVSEAARNLAKIVGHLDGTAERENLREYSRTDLERLVRNLSEQVARGSPGRAVVAPGRAQSPARTKENGASMGNSGGGGAALDRGALITLQSQIVAHLNGGRKQSIFQQYSKAELGILRNEVSQQLARLDDELTTARAYLASISAHLDGTLLDSRLVQHSRMELEGSQTALREKVYKMTDCAGHDHSLAHTRKTFKGKSKKVIEWDVDQVVEWLSHSIQVRTALGPGPRNAEIIKAIAVTFKSEEVDGETLRAYARDELKKDLNISAGLTTKLMQAINELRTHGWDPEAAAMCVYLSVVLLDHPAIVI